MMSYWNGLFFASWTLYYDMRYGYEYGLMGHITLAFCLSGFPDKREHSITEYCWERTVGIVYLGMYDMRIMQNNPRGRSLGPFFRYLRNERPRRRP
jgi:hypothetical protein